MNDWSVKRPKIRTLKINKYISFRIKVIKIISDLHIHTNEKKQFSNISGLTNLRSWSQGVSIFFSKSILDSWAHIAYLF